MNVVIHRDFPFLEQWRAIHAAGPVPPELEVSLRRLIDAWNAGQSPSPSPELMARAAGSSVPYDLAGGYALITLQTPSLLVVYSVGLAKEMEHWLTSHPSVMLMALIEGQRVSITVLGDVEMNDLELLGSGDALDPHVPLLPRIGGIDWKREIGHGGLAKRLLSFTKDLDPEELDDTLAELEPRRPEVADLILRVIYHLMDDRIDQARAAVAAYLGKGQVVRLEREVSSGPAPEALDGLEELVMVDRLSPADLDRLLDPKRFQAWMQFLHPEQRKKVNEDYDHPIVLRGVSGSGKTVVLVHRARRLALANPKARVLLTTLNHDLAILLKTLAAQLAGSKDLSNLQVYSFTGYLRTIVQGFGFDHAAEAWSAHLSKHAAVGSEQVTLGSAYRDEVFAPQKDWVYQNLFQDFLGDPRHGCPAEPLQRLRRTLDRRADAATYLREEVDYVRSVDYCHQDYLAYLDVGRSGRSVGLNRKLREDVLTVTRAWERYQWRRGIADPSTLSQIVFLLLDQSAGIPEAARCEHLLVDEFQDLSTLELKLLARVPLAERNGVFVAGDDAQRISVKHLHLPETPLGNRSYRRAIFKNYRNTRDILEAGTALLHRHGKGASSSGSDLEILDPDYDDRRGPKPALVRVPQPLEAAWKLALDRSRVGIQPCTICLATANSSKLPVEAILNARPEGVNADVLSGEYLEFPTRFVVSDIAGIKGFEFTNLILLGVEEGMFPRAGSPKEEQWRDALRLYAAITRGRDEVHLFYRNKLSPLVKDIQDRFEKKTPQ